MLRQLPAAGRFLIVKLSTFRAVGVFSPFVALPLSPCGFAFLLFLIFHVVGSAFLQVLLAPQTKLRGRGASVKVEGHGGSESDKAPHNHPLNSAQPVSIRMNQYISLRRMTLSQPIAVSAKGTGGYSKLVNSGNESTATFCSCF